MGDIDTSLSASRRAIDDLIALAETRPEQWTTPRAPGKWSPSQLVEHIARSFEESAHMAAGRPTKFPTVPTILRPIVRRLLFARVLRTSRFPKARTNRAMDPVSGPSTVAEGRARLAAAHGVFEDECRKIAGCGGQMPSTAFGNVPLVDYVRFMEAHTRHHAGQMNRA